MLTFLVKILHLLNAENSPREIAIAVSLGGLWGLSPVLSMQGIFALLLVLVLKANISSFILAGGAFSLMLSVVREPISVLGESLLTSPALTPTFTELYQFSLFKLANLHYTTTLGALVVSIALFIPLYFFSIGFIRVYRKNLQAIFAKLRIVKAIKTSRFYRLYLTMREVNV